MENLFRSSNWVNIKQLSVTEAQNSSECFSKLRIEDGVDDWIYTRVDVSQQSCGLEGKVSRRGVQIVFNAQGIQDVTSEEGNPTN